MRVGSFVFRHISCLCCDSEAPRIMNEMLDLVFSLIKIVYEEYNGLVLQGADSEVIKRECFVFF